MSVFDFIKKPDKHATGAVSGAQAQTKGQAHTVSVPAIATGSSPTISPPISQSPAVADLLNTHNVVQQSPSTQSIQTPNGTAQNSVTLQAPAKAVGASVVIPPVVTTSTQQNLGPQKINVGSEGGQLARQAFLDIMTHLNQRANRVLVAAQSKAKEVQSELVDSEHLLAGLLTDAEVVALLVEMKLEIPKIEAALAELYKRTLVKTTPQVAPRVKKIVEVALADARKTGIEIVSPEHILLALFEEGEGLGARLLAKLGVQGEDIRKRVTEHVANANKAVVNPDGTITKPQETKKSALAEFTIDVTAKAERGELDPVVERAEEIERVVQVLSRRTKNNPALVGEPGVGKTAILEGLAQRIVSRQVPESLLGKRILQLDLMSVLAGASHRGEFEQRMKDLIEEVCAGSGQYVMFIDEMHTIIGAGGGGEGSLDAANFLKPALARGDLQMIGATTLTEYRKYVEKDPALERRFQPVQIPEPTEEAAIKMLKALRPKYEKFHKVSIPDTAIESAVKLSKRYVGDRFLPDKAIDLIDEAASAVRLPMMSLPEEIQSLEERVSQLTTDKQTAISKNDTVRAKVLTGKLAEIEPKLAEKKADYESRKNQSTVEVTELIIKDVVSRWTGVPVSKLTGSESERLTKLEQIMHERMIGQERAVKSVAAAVRRGRAGLKSNKRPIGSFIFLGPTGVGKTELTKTLAEVLFGQEDAMVRFDMTEFMEKHEVAKLLGPPPGYVGYEEGGKLTEAVRRKPYSVVLFDEVEKAHPDIFNILLQILDDGRLTDNKGRTISFKNTVVICTSNIGTQLIQDKLLKKAQQTNNTQEEATNMKEVRAGSQSDKKTPQIDEPSTEFTGMEQADVAPQYRGAQPHFDEAELKIGYQYEDEVGADMSTGAYTELKDLVMGELRKFFRAELINRFDEVIVFEPLQFKHMKKIVELQLKALTKLLEEQNLGLTITDAAKEQIVIAGFDPVYGARPLRRAIQKLLENPISEMIIAKKAQDGDIIIVDFAQDFVFKTEKPQQVVHEQSQEPKNSSVGAGALGQQEGLKKQYARYKCVTSGFEFAVEVCPNSTTICPLNVKEKVQKVEGASEIKAPTPVSADAHLDTSVLTPLSTTQQPTTVDTGYMGNAYQTATA